MALENKKKRRMKPSRTQQDILDEPVRCAPADIRDVKLAVLMRNEHFCVIDKPADVRMDGDFDITVEKLLLMHIKKPDGSASTPKDFKWVHQLDFATSGALCVALSREGAAAASSCFEHREVEKHYLSVLSGTLDLDKYEFCEYEPDEKVMCPYKKQKTSHVASAETQHETWQAQVRKQNLDALWKELHSIDIVNIDPALKEEYEEVKQFSYDEFLKGPKRRKRLRKLMKQLGVDVDLIESSHESQPTTVESDENIDFPAALEGAALLEVLRSYQSPSRTPPAVFRPSQSTNKLIIRVPVAEVPNDFRMEPGHARNPGKACETELTVLEHATYQGQAVTKVLMRPRTGRRHQLRIHSLVLGHPIVGDTTYQQQHYRATSSAGESSGCSRLAARMMLHAHTLKIPFPSAGKTSRNFKAFLDRVQADNLLHEVAGGDGRHMVQCLAPDPFPVIAGEIVPVLPDK